MNFFILYGVVLNPKPILAQFVGFFLNLFYFGKSKKSERMSSSNKEQPVKEDIFFFLVSTRCLIWPRVVLDFLFIKDPHLAKVMSTLISRDITHKVARHFNPNLLIQASTPDFQA